MPRFAPLLLAAAILPLAGCADIPKGQVERLQQQNNLLSTNVRDLQERAKRLDAAQQESESLLAQSKQQNKVLEDQLAAVRDQLRSVTTQLAQVKSEKTDTDKKVEAMTASMRRQSGIAIAPNNSFLQTLPSLNLPPNHVRRDGDVIRVTLPGSQLFEPGTARLRPAATNLIIQAGNELVRLYPDQMVGIEGYTDSDPIAGGQFRSNHELSMARALAVYDVLTTRTRLQANQIFVAGHGPNRPLVSNGSHEGKEMNRRVELVIYPEKKPQ